jgi:hypothetical protein
MRVADWPERLRVLLEQMAVTPFEWGRADCFIWAVRAACAVTGAMPGERYGAPWFFQYFGRTGALRILAQHSMAEVGDQAFGNRVPPLCAQRGDIALVPAGDGSEAFAIVDHERCLCVAVSGGLTFVPIDRAMAAWRIG